MGRGLTGGRGLLPGCGRGILSVFNHGVRHQLSALTWGSYLQKQAEGQPHKGCCWKQDLETFFWFPVSVWGWACVCVVFFWCNWYLPYFDIKSAKSSPELLCVFMMIFSKAFLFWNYICIGWSSFFLFLFWCFSESCFLCILNYVLQTVIRWKLLRSIQCLGHGRRLVFLEWNECLQRCV